MKKSKLLIKTIITILLYAAAGAAAFAVFRLLIGKAISMDTFLSFWVSLMLSMLVLYNTRWLWGGWSRSADSPGSYQSFLWVNTLILILGSAVIFILPAADTLRYEIAHTVAMGVQLAANAVLQLLRLRDKK